MIKICELCGEIEAWGNGKYCLDCKVEIMQSYGKRKREARKRKEQEDKIARQNIEKLESYQTEIEA